jgi:molybdopterin converting factor small subunit
MESGGRIMVTVRYHNILRQHAGVEHEHLELPESEEVSAAIYRLANRHGPGLREMLLSADGGLSPHLVIFVNQQVVFPSRQAVILADGDELRLFPTISGG